MSVSFTNPPLIEVAASVVFEKVPGFSAVHFGLFWNLLRGDFPVFRQMPELAQSRDGFENSTPVFELVDVPGIRGWFISEDDTQVIQVQRDRFIMNWREGNGKAAYPRFSEVHRRLLLRWTEFQSFLLSEDLPVPNIVQCDLAYVNRIEIDGTQNALNAASAVLQNLQPLRHGAVQSVCEGISLNVGYLLTDDLGRLRVAAATSKHQGNPVLQLSLSIVGTPNDSSTDGASAWFEKARDEIVSTFVEITKEPMHTVWGKSV